MYASTHEMPLFPGTGELGERGEHDQIVNAPLRAGDTGQVFREAMREAILLRLADFAPDLLVVSAGFHVHCRDPLANLNGSHCVSCCFERWRLERAGSSRSGGRKRKPTGDEHFFDSPLAKIRTVPYVVVVVRTERAPGGCGFAAGRRARGKILIWKSL